MNSQPFDPFESQPPACADTNPFFDRAGLAWIAACVAIAVAAGRWIPPLAEPGALHGATQASPATSAASAPVHAGKRVPLQVAGEEPRPAKTVRQLQLGMF